MRTTTASKIAGLLLTGAVVTMLGCGWMALRELKVGGPVYQRIVMGKELVADVLPPRAFLLEAYLETTLIANEPWSLAPRRTRLVQLHKEYDDRLAYWRQQDLNPALRNQLLNAAHQPAQRFWDVIEKTYLPAVEKGDSQAAGDAFLSIKEAFEDHHAANDAVVAGATRLSSALEAESAAIERNILRIVGALAVAILAIVAGCCAGVVWGLARPVARMTQVMTKLASGDLDVEVPMQTGKNEIGEMAMAVVVFRDAAVEKVRLAREAEEERAHGEEARRRAEAEAIDHERTAVANSIGTGLAKLAAKDLTYRMTNSMPEAYHKLQSDFNAALEQLERAVQSVHAGTQAMDSGTREISTASNDLSRRTEAQAASLEETAAALDEITTTVNKATDGAAHARRVVANAKGDAEKGGDVVRKAVEAMGDIERSSEQIGQIIGIIDEIALQTNLLALNAGVEAARAGDAGRGFAVVASEVRALAQRSAEAAKQIKALIAASTAQVERGVELVAETGKSLVARADPDPGLGDQRGGLRHCGWRAGAGDGRAAGQHRRQRDGQGHATECSNGGAGHGRERRAFAAGRPTGGAGRSIPGRPAGCGRSTRAESRVAPPGRLETARTGSAAAGRCLAWPGGYCRPLIRPMVGSG